jgi:hypothetical protein
MGLEIPSHVRISNIVTAAKAKKRLPPMYAIICAGMLHFSDIMHRNLV